MAEIKFGGVYADSTHISPADSYPAATSGTYLGHGFSSNIMQEFLYQKYNLEPMNSFEKICLEINETPRIK